MAEAKEVSQLPTDVSIHWAKSQELLAGIKPSLSEASTILPHAIKGVVLPDYFTAFDIFTGARLSHPTWAVFNPPPGYSDQNILLFTNQIAPRLGSDEQLDDKISRIQAVVVDKGEGEKADLVGGLQEIIARDNDAIFIDNRRNQYAKG